MPADLAAVVKQGNLGGQQENLFALFVGTFFFAIEERLLGAHHGLVVLKIGIGQLLRVEIVVRLSQQLFMVVRAHGTRQGGIGQHEAAFRVFHVHEVRHVVDQRAQHAAFFV